jgi:hypothetical protein
VQREFPDEYTRKQVKEFVENQALRPVTCGAGGMRCWKRKGAPADPGMGSRPQPLRLLPFMPHSLASFILVAGLLAAAAAAAAGWLLSAGSSGYM